MKQGSVLVFSHNPLIHKAVNTAHCITGPQGNRFSVYIEKRKPSGKKDQAEKRSTSRNIASQLPSNGKQVTGEYHCAPNSPHAPAGNAGRNAARAGAQRHAVITAPSCPLENRRGPSPLPVTLDKGTLDTSLAGQTCKDFFFFFSLQSSREAHTQARRAGASPLVARPGTALRLHADGVYGTLQGPPAQSKQLCGFAR